MLAPIIEHSGEPLEPSVRWLLVGAIALTLACIASLMQSIQVPQEQYSLFHRGGLITLISAFFILLLGVLKLPAIPLLLALALLLLVPIFYGIKVWIQVFNAEEITLH